MSTSVRPLVSPSVVSMQYYSKEAKHIVYLSFQVGGDGGGEFLTSLRITRESSSSSSGSSTWSGWMRTAWEYCNTSSGRAPHPGLDGGVRPGSMVTAAAAGLLILVWLDAYGLGVW